MHATCSSSTAGASVLALALLLLPAVAGAAESKAGPVSGRPDYPPTQVRAVNDTLHGTVITDPYRWLEGDDEAVRAWTATQNKFTQERLAAWPGRAALRARFEKLFAIPDVGAPSVYGRRYFSTRRDGLQNHAVVYVREGQFDGPAKPVLDPNTFSQDGTVALDWRYTSPDGGRIAYGKSAGGDEQSTLYVRDVATGRDLPDMIPNTARASVAWDPDGNGFSYTRHPARGEVPAGQEVFHVKIYHHRIGDDPSKDVVVVGKEGRAFQENLGVGASADWKWLFYSRSLDWAKNDLFVRANGAGEPFRPVAVGLDGRVGGDGYKGTLYLLTNVNAPRYRVVTAPPATPEPANWKELIPQQTGVMDGMDIIAGRIVLLVSEAAVSHVYLYSLDGKLEKEIPMPAPGTVTGISGDPDGAEMFFRFDSFTYPGSIYRYDFATGALALVDRADADFDPADFETRQVFAESKDGTRVPLFVVYKRGLHLDGARPALLSGYGGFAVTEAPRFRASVMAWLEHGGVFASACLRGGDEYGREWHEAGRLGRKQNVFDDFHACAEWLIGNRFTSPEKLAASGGSNGGLLVGAALTQRPDLFHAILCQVPLLDMLRYDKFLIGKYWVPEYGTADDAKQFEWLKAYSPYQNVKPGTKYPATLFTAGEGDSRVHPLHARKMAALVQAQTGGDAPILLRVEGKAGHGQGKPTSKRLDEAVDLYGFLMWQLGM
ncbi:MAG: S9 family peptidase [Candidatus Eisenbacteria bacterium]|nr:S9 family peptidase [Candidatus Eisenbacteria bacterium]